MLDWSGDMCEYIVCGLIIITCLSTVIYLIIEASVDVSIAKDIIERLQQEDEDG